MGVCMISNIKVILLYLLHKGDTERREVYCHFFSYFNFVVISKYRLSAMRQNIGSNYMYIMIYIKIFKVNVIVMLSYFI